MRYYFHVVTKDAIVKDTCGAELQDDDSAQEEARAIVVEMERELPQYRNSGAILEVHVEERRVFALPIFSRG